MFLSPGEKNRGKRKVGVDRSLLRLKVGGARRLWGWAKLDLSRERDLSEFLWYRVVPGHRNWQIKNCSLEFGRFPHCGFRNPLAKVWAFSWWFIETVVWNLAGFFTVGLENSWQGFGQFLNDLWFSQQKSQIFSMPVKNLNDILQDVLNDLLNFLLQS